ncbi:hypothetical protein [Mesorhizobium sp. WSM2240]|uniref:Transposase n=1 Tax=Mesorhizobium sp. WSM2240 TaxID=3228851 RepID=A0AAU8CS87_9HYPH
MRNATKRGEITRTGNAAARSMLIESAWHCRFPAGEGQALRGRSAKIPDRIRSIAWKAQVRLCGKFRRLAASGKRTVKIVTAIARELAGFVWDIARQFPSPGERHEGSARRAKLVGVAEPGARGQQKHGGDEGIETGTWLACCAPLLTRTILDTARGQGVTDARSN